MRFCLVKSLSTEEKFERKFQTVSKKVNKKIIFRERKENFLKNIA